MPEFSAKTHRAIALHEEGMSVFKAAAKVGIYPTTLYNALERLGKKKKPKKRKKPLDVV